ncbi:GAF domain-containing protein [Paenibacillus alba]|uniref:GAF domain-containing protein n=1 Tax=Paenibacillus alba TaxID=1197127 RepID=A0ABU6G2U2_9BACL|nr:GAF domain-containing protein [Paenibacillus alba]MEC0228488.1 GAF domain-containing protein [Paenibacillus alba]
MAIGDTSLKVELALLQSLTSSDFMALASLQGHSGRGGWDYVWGNRNDRYQHMVIRAGHGLAGTALRLGRWVKIDGAGAENSQERLHCPMMLAEHLQSAAVFPLMTTANRQIVGLIYLGKRKQSNFEVNELLAAQEKIATLASLLEGIIQETAK